VHCEITVCDSDNKQSLILSYLIYGSHCENHKVHCIVGYWAEETRRDDPVSNLLTNIIAG